MKILLIWPNSRNEVLGWGDLGAVAEPLALEYLAAGVREYWIIDRFQRTLTVYARQGTRARKRVVPEKQSYTTVLLPGFELPLARQLKVADSWPRGEAESA